MKCMKNWKTEMGFFMSARLDEMPSQEVNNSAAARRFFWISGGGLTLSVPYWVLGDITTMILPIGSVQ